MTPQRMTRRSVWGRMVWATVLAVCLSSPGLAKEPAHPEVVKILEKHVEALGGQAKLAAIQSVHKTGTYAYNGLEHDLEIWQKRPNQMRIEIDGLNPYGTFHTPGQKTVRAFDGSAAWQIVEAQGPDAKVLEASEAPDLIQGGAIDGALVGALDKGHTVTLVGETEIEGRPVYHLSLERKDGGQEEWYLGRDNFLPVLKTVQVGERAFLEAHTWHFDDYREVAGVQFPFYVMVEEKVFSREHIYSEIVVNAEFSDAKFELKR